MRWIPPRSWRWRGREAADLVVVGPEAPLGAGVADALEAAGIAVFGPHRAAARMETSKAFCHDVAEAAGVRVARARAFAGGDEDAAVAFVRELAADGTLSVLKADGLAAGKGVIVTDSLEQALALVPSFLAGRPAGEPALVIEERLSVPRPASSPSATAPAPSRCPPPATTSAWATTTTGRTPAAWVPTRRCRISTTPRWTRCSGRSTCRSSRSSSAAAPRSAASCTRASCSRTPARRCWRPTSASGTRRPRRSCCGSPGTSRPCSPPPPPGGCRGPRIPPAGARGRRRHDRAGGQGLPGRPASRRRHRGDR